MKKFLSLVLTFAMVFSLAMPAMAAEPTVNGGTSGNVTASYTPSSTDTTPAEITGVSITVDGETYTEGNVTITPTSTVVFTVTGTNFANLSADNYLWYAVGNADPLNNGGWTIDTAADRATWDLSDYIFWFESCDNFEVMYSNGGNVSSAYVGTGIYLTYDDGTAPTYDVTTNDDSTRGTITVDKPTAKAGETVTVTFTPNEGYVLFYQGAYNPENGSVVVELTPGADANTYTFTMPAHAACVYGEFVKDGRARTDLYFNNDGNTDWTDVDAYFYTDSGGFIDSVRLTMAEDGVYTLPEGTQIPNLAYKICFTNNTVWTAPVDIPTGEENKFTLGTTTDEYGQYDGTWSVYTPSQPPTDVTSANIVWGSLAYTYTDEAGAWSNDGSNGAGTVTVKNTGTTNFSAQPIYTAETDYDEIVGQFYDSADAEQYNTMGVLLDSEASHTFHLRLFNQPEKAIPAGTKIGTVTIRIIEGNVN